MPYIKMEQRQLIDEHNLIPRNAGELNYTITKLIRDYYTIGGNYQAINDVVGALEGAKLEFYRRVATSYEDAKIQDNGDVY